MKPQKNLRGGGTALIWSIIFAGTYLLAVRTRVGQSIEQSVLDEANFSVNPELPLAAVQPVIIIIFLSVLSGYLFLTRNKYQAIFLWFFAGIILFGAQIAKLLLERQELLGEDAEIILVENTLPSGHMSVFVALGLALLIVVPKCLKNLTLWIGDFLLAIVIWQLLDYGWHRPSDIFAALAFSVAVGSVLLFVYPSFQSINHLRDCAASSRISGTAKVLTVFVVFGFIGFVVWTGIRAHGAGTAYIYLAFLACIMLTTIGLKSFARLLN